MRKLVFAAVPVAAVLLGAGNFFYNFALNRNSQVRRQMETRFHKAPPNPDGPPPPAGEEALAWLREKGEARWIRSGDGLRLHGVFVPNAASNGRCAVVCHGYTGDCEEMADYALHFYRLGFSVLLPDARAHGQSEGSARGMGWPERKDLLKWIGLITKEVPASQLFLFGVSMGGATVMMTAGETLPPQVKAVIEDCGYSSAWEEFEGSLHAMFGLPPFPIMHAASLVTKVRGGYFLSEASAVRQLQNCRVPILFLHGGEDHFVPTAMLDVVYDAAPGEKEKCLIPGAGHAASVKVNPELYWSTVDRFLDRHFSLEKPRTTTLETEEASCKTK